MDNFTFKEFCQRLLQQLRKKSSILAILSYCMSALSIYYIPAWNSSEIVLHGTIVLTFISPIASLIINLGLDWDFWRKKHPKWVDGLLLALNLVWGCWINFAFPSFIVESSQRKVIVGLGWMVGSCLCQILMVNARRPPNYLGFVFGYIQGACGIVVTKAYIPIGCEWYEGELKLDFTKESLKYFWIACALGIIAIFVWFGLDALLERLFQSPVPENLEISSEEQLKRQEDDYLQKMAELQGRIEQEKEIAKSWKEKAVEEENRVASLKSQFEATLKQSQDQLRNVEVAHKVQMEEMQKQLFKSIERAIVEVDSLAITSMEGDLKEVVLHSTLKEREAAGSKIEDTQ